MEKILSIGAIGDDDDCDGGHVFIAAQDMEKRKKKRYTILTVHFVVFIMCPMGNLNTKHLAYEHVKTLRKAQTQLCSFDVYKS
ncbi:hypothetical protein MRB53_007924 [Persea americana]|uniref:Uncharacterized protein n=1 Tax=Persea americana TaxID=3435 RepID=A0ACC2ML96_PERAE|nr:hypothetical protein MRB53_007924 [Persea americana]